VLERDQVRRRLWMQKIPLTMHKVFLKELEELKLIEQQGCRHILICKKNIEEFYLRKE